MTAFKPSNLALESLADDNSQRADWVNMQLVKSFMQYTKRSMLASSFVTLLMAGVLYKTAPTVGLVAWLVLSNMVIFGRYAVVLQYQKTMTTVKGPRLRKFLARHDFLWVLGGVLWGLSTLLFVGKSSGFEQFICGLILIGVSCFTLYSYAARLRCYFAFSNALSGTVLAVFVYCLAFDEALTAGADSVSLIVLTVIFHMMLRYFAINFHELQRTSLQLQFDNELLVKSLTAKSTAALDAVENKNRFIASAAHDLRQPMHALNLYASWLVEEPELSPKVAPQIVRCTQAINALFDSLFDLSGLNADSPHINWQQVSLADLLLDLKHQFAPLAYEKGVQLRLYTSSATVEALSDPVLLKRLVGNLISNALKNTTSGGVLLALRRSQGRWRIEVWDTGVGIEPSFQRAIFKEFYRVPRTGTEEGFGLGLAIAQRFAQLLNHSLHMRSKPGRGSVFWIEQQHTTLLASTAFNPGNEAQAKAETKANADLVA